MAIFEDVEAAKRARERITELTGVVLNRSFEAVFARTPCPDLALTNLERWLRATSSPHLYLEQVLSHPAVGGPMVDLLGGSQPIADLLIQNPELASLLFEPGTLDKKPIASEIEEEGGALLDKATSRSHELDRLRFVKQRWLLPIVVNDLAGLWTEEAVWLALSELADALLNLCARVVWRTIDSNVTCPVAIVAFGKLGGKELNYSSDVDLAFVSTQPSVLEIDALAVRFAEDLVRALCERMGRGSLYRVDLRLRPYGAAGPLVSSFEAFEAYYRSYAEPWECQALLRSRIVVGSADIASRWESLVRDRCYRPRTNEASVAQMLETKARIEESASEGDLKRRSGGIRDVEFLAQILQMIYGFDRPEVQVKSTCDALRALDRAGALEHAAATSLLAGYTFLRQLEHRCQLVGDRQTHELPEGDRAQAVVAALSRELSWESLMDKLEFHTRTIQTLYRTIIQNEPGSQWERANVLHALGPFGPSVLQWIDVLPDSGAFYESLATNEGSLRRVELVARYAPALIGYFKRSVALTELIVSGEIEEPNEESERIERLPIDSSLEITAEAFANSWSKVCTRWALEPTFDLTRSLTDLTDSLLTHCLKRLYITFDVVALGSYARRDLTLSSDADLLLLVDTVNRQAEAETQAQNLLAMCLRLKRLGAPIVLDLRLRPEGGKGLLVRSYEGFQEYDLEGMEMWERLALGQARTVIGGSAALDLVSKAAYALPLTPERLHELLAVKKRIESERVAHQRSRRHVKLGIGGLSDIEWFVRLHEMRYPTATRPEPSRPLDDRIRALGRTQLVNAVEVEQLVSALAHLTTLRLRLCMLGIQDDVLPENPDKLNRLAEQFGDADGNSLLLRHEAIIDGVRAIYRDGLERLRAI